MAAETLRVTTCVTVFVCILIDECFQRGSEIKIIFRFDWERYLYHCVLLVV
jgi:hypothetical protein